MKGWVGEQEREGSFAFSKEYDERFALEIRIGIRISGMAGRVLRWRKFFGNTLFLQLRRAACNVQRNRRFRFFVRKGGDDEHGMPETPMHGVTDD
ncbi:hypothetical protein [Burkholderia multivorans]|uniref:hypothetical protein n=1 Tax=Burkholderia multivorans TaxID=87883 RepID=UPI0019085799|nr:hypothetical protein [Burkholderia multivorans]MBJ9624689.1 hypothetical protein [Burkholderia multivorans]